MRDLVQAHSLPLGGRSHGHCSNEKTLEFRKSNYQGVEDIGQIVSLPSSLKIYFTNEPSIVLP